MALDKFPNILPIPDNDNKPPTTAELEQRAKTVSELRDEVNMAQQEVAEKRALFGYQLIVAADADEAQAVLDAYESATHKLSFAIDAAERFHHAQGTVAEVLRLSVEFAHAKEQVERIFPNTE